MGAPAYRRGPWAALSDIIRSLSSFRAIGWSAVPCHRVVGADGRLTGYAGGLERKARLLALEKAGGEPLHFPSKGEAL